MRATLILLAVLIIFPAVLIAAEQPLTIEVTGEAAGSDLEAPREVYERAKNEAQRVAVEQAVGTFVRSHSIVSNGQLAEDLIHARVRGKIERLEVLSQERDKNDPNHYRVKVRATVVPVFADKSEGITIQAALSRAELKAGEDVRLQYRVSTHCYVYIFVIGSDNSITQLLPNAGMPDNKAETNRMYHFPPENGNIRLTAQLQEESQLTGANERVKIIATKKEEPLLHGGFKEGFKVYDGKSTGLVSDLLRRLSQLDAADWGEVTLQYRIMPK